jgi:glycosyltransferase involved in cell wall biosynthesis
MKRIGIIVVAYNAASTLASVLDRIPRSFVPRVERIIVNDDYSDDATYLVGLGYRQLSDLPLEVIRHPRNLGYGGNQKAGYRWAMEHGLDVVVLLHGDGQYAPELLPEIVAPLERDEADAVFGSRLLVPGAARKGGMPLYKLVGNRILTRYENWMVGTELSEWHSGYRAYSVAALRDIPFERNSNGFDFDTQIIIQLHEAGKRITEIPIPTYYGDEICYVNGLRYAWDITRAVTRYRAHKMGFGTGELAFATQGYALKGGEHTSHGVIVGWLADRPRCRVLDLGCADGALGERLRALGHEVTGVDHTKLDGVGERLDRFVEADLERGIPEEVGDGYDVVLLADVLEHTRDPQRLLAEARRCVSPHGSVIVSVPNFAHWYPRLRVAAGRFDYDRQGILDRTHLRFFTRRSFERLAGRVGLSTRRRTAVGLPLEVLDRGRRSSGEYPGARGLLGRLDHAAVEAWPTLFGYQFVYELDPVTADRPA